MNRYVKVKKYVQAASLILQASRLEDKALEMTKRAKALLGQEGFGLCYGTDDQSIRLEVPLADYMKHFPNAKPSFHTWEYEGRKRCRMDYPAALAGVTADGVNVWVDARTDACDLPEEKKEGAA